MIKHTYIRNSLKLLYRIAILLISGSLSIARVFPIIEHKSAFVAILLYVYMKS